LRQPLEEQGIPDFHLGAWLGFIAPRGTPQAVVAKLHGDLNRVLNDPDINARLVALGSEVVSSPSPAAFRQMVEQNYRTWGDLVKVANVAKN